MAATIASRQAEAGGFAKLAPLAKIGLWIGSMALLAGVGQWVTFLAGMDLNILTSGSARGVLLALALVTLIYMMALDRRSVSDYGLVADRRWSRDALGGLLLGVAIYAAFCAVATYFGVFDFQVSGVTASRVGKTMLAAFGAIPVAVLQQIIFSGYLASTLRDRHSLATSIILPSVLFGMLSALGLDGGLLTAEAARFGFGMFLISALLCTLRMSFGNLAFPAAILGGAIILRRFIRSLGLLAFQPDSPWANWFAPGGDPRQAPLMWLMVGGFLTAAAIVLWRNGEYRLSGDQPAMDASFKRVMPLSNLLGLAPIDLWIPLLVDARFSIGLKYVPRLIVTLTASLVNTILTLPERLLAPLFIRHEVPDPLFIVGVHRSGTTHLHNMLALDPRYVSPRTYQVFNPHGFLTGWATTLLLGPFMTWKRPMDAVQLHMFSPQEEEFAITCMTTNSPYWLACLPQRYGKYERFIYPDRMADSERATWKRQFTLFLRKLTFWSRKSPLLKSPYNTARVGFFREMFPRAKFVHIVRHPHAVYRSNMHLAEHGWAVFQLQDADPNCSFGSNFLENYVAQEEAYERDRRKLPAHDVADVRFEDLETDPIGEIERIYAQLGLEVSDRFRRRLVAYLASIEGYQKNRFRPLPEQERKLIDSAIGHVAAKWGYEDISTPAVKPRRAA